jgi:hypothetical protein
MVGTSTDPIKLKWLLGEITLKIEYLFQPDEVNEIIQNHTCIKEKINNPSKEGTTSESFPLARKSSREIYRILCNQHYPHLQELLKDLEFCMSKGWQQPRILQTCSMEEFNSLLSELTVALHFAKIGSEIKSYDDKKTQESVPDLMVVKGDLSCICEVYSPRDWDEVEYFKEDLRLSILHLDIPWDFDFSIRIDMKDHFDEKGNLKYFDPWQFSDCYVNSIYRSKKITPVIYEIGDLFNNSTKIIKKIIDEPNNTITEIIFKQISPSQFDLPAREGSIIGPSLTGYSPEGMFDRLIQRRIRSKIKKAQTYTISDVDLRALFVDISYLGYVHQFYHTCYQKRFIESIKNYFDFDSLKVDMVIFFCPIRANEKSIEVPLLFKKPTTSLDIVESLISTDLKNYELSDTTIVIDKT